MKKMPAWLAFFSVGATNAPVLNVRQEPMRVALGVVVGGIVSRAPHHHGPWPSNLVCCACAIEALANEAAIARRAATFMAGKRFIKWPRFEATARINVCKPLAHAASRNE